MGAAGPPGLAQGGGTARTVAQENALSGSPMSEWETQWDEEAIEGFVTDYSVLPGDTVRFKVRTTSSRYRIRIYRLGWYQGHGARRLADVTPSATLPQQQPAPLQDLATGLVDCGNWAESASWTVPADAVSGVFYALFERLDGGGSNFTLFVVRRPGPSDILVQTSEMTMHAYSRFGGNSLYAGEPVGRAYQVSYNRPFNNGEAESHFLNAEIALVRWLERNGYDVSYCGGIDVHRDAAVLQGRKVFISSGHDEYVSAPQRRHVEEARDAGVHLVFMTGNEYFWRVRFEPSTDASATPDRTMVCYKETLADAKIDPTQEWTGTWRDPRFSPPAIGGGLPENALTGQLFRAILPVSNPDFVITVPGEYAAHRLWRNTEVADLAIGESLDLGANTLGYEFDVDADNGFRPPGLIRLSTTEAEVPQLLQDYGATYVRGTCTHHLTMYRASSGALVFGTGTVQWAYGLDDYHVADADSPTDRTMQQATLNLLADMGVQPQTRMPGLVSASASTDTMGPVATVTAPAAGTMAPLGAPVTVTGTAVDSGGGIVAAVEASFDGGATWHPAVGRESWSCVFTPVELGDVEVLVRAVDDSCNIGQPARLPLVGAPRGYPCSVWPEGTVPQTPSVDETAAVEVGVRFQSTEAGFVTGLRFFKGQGNTGTHVGTLWTDAGVMLAQATFADESPSGWQTVAIRGVPVSAGTTYVVSVFMPGGRYAADAGYFGQAYELVPLRAPANGEGGMANGVYRYGSPGFPTSTFGAANYWVDVMFDIDNREAPTVVDHRPAAGLQSVAVDTSVAVTFSEAMDGDSVLVEIHDPLGVPVEVATAYDETTRTVTVTPQASLGRLQEYAVHVLEARDTAGHPLEPYTWGFTTVGEPGTSPASLWDTSATPTTSNNDTSPLELGCRFHADHDGTVTALRYYRAPGGSGTRVGHLWSAGGVLLASAAYANESAEGWQQVNLTTPVEITAGSSYVVSYHAPSGVYASTTGYFSQSSRDSGVLHAPSSQAVDGNGVYAFGSGSFPVSSYQHTNYWVDVVFVQAPDVGPPQVLNVEPAPALVAVARDTRVTVAFDEPVAEASLELVLRDGTGAVVPSSVTYDAQAGLAVLTPAALLAVGASYTASVTATDLVGNAIPTPVEWTFTTDTALGSTPATLWDSGARPQVAAVDEASPVELGVRFRAARTGSVSGIRFYKGPGNNGPHIGHLWSDAGELLGTVAFTDESATGWQQARFAAPVAVQAGRDYVASYHAPQGHYSFTSAGLSGAHERAPLTAPGSSGSAGNGVFAYGAGGFPSSSWGATNYWVDVVFDDGTGPSVLETSPGAGATVPPDSSVTATFDEAVDPASLVVDLRDGGGGVVAGVLTYDAATRTLTFDPADELAPGASYTATVQAAQDTQGNPLAMPVSWSFAVVGDAYASLWSPTTTPGTLTAEDAGPLNLGLRFRVGVAGSVHGVRFYKGGPGNAGPHVGSLWAADGTELASVSFGGETARGWQVGMFSTPVPVEPGTTYVVSYFAPYGRYSVDGGYFASTGYAEGPLEALRNGEEGGNGLYRYGGSPALPAQTYNAANYWVDVLFVEG